MTTQATTIAREITAGTDIDETTDRDGNTVLTSGRSRLVVGESVDMTDATTGAIGWDATVYVNDEPDGDPAIWDDVSSAFATTEDELRAIITAWIG